MEVNLKKSSKGPESPRNSLKAVEFLMNQMKQYAKRKSLKYIMTLGDLNVTHNVTLSRDQSDFIELILELNDLLFRHVLCFLRNRKIKRLLTLVSLIIKLIFYSRFHNYVTPYFHAKYNLGLHFFDIYV